MEYQVCVSRSGELGDVHEGRSEKQMRDGMSTANLAPPSRPWGICPCRVTRPSAARAPTSAHPSDHLYTSDHCTAAWRPGWRDAHVTLPPSSHQRASTSCRSIPLARPRSRRDAGLMAPESWAEDWGTVSDRSPDPGH